MVYKVYIGEPATLCVLSVHEARYHIIHRDHDEKLSLVAISGGLPAGTTEAEVEREFTKFGTLSSVWVARKPPGFGERYISSFYVMSVLCSNCV